MSMEHYELYSDEELVSMYRNGDERAVDAIMERYKNHVRKKAHAMYIVGGEKDDLIQEGMIGLYKAVTTYDKDKEASFMTFASLCINGQIMNAVKASNTKKNAPLNGYISLDEPVNSADDNADMKLVDTLAGIYEQNPELLYIDREYTGNLEQRVFETLSPLEKKVIKLLMGGKDYVKIAQELNRPPKSIDNAIQRARTKIGKAISQNNT